jgi:hypothetical protein
MTIHIQRFVDRVRGLEARGAKDFTMSMQDAKDVHADITRLLLDLQALRENTVSKASDDTVVNLQVDGGAF